MRDIVLSIIPQLERLLSHVNVVVPHDAVT